MLAMVFWQRTSSSSLMSWASLELTRLGRCQLSRMILPAARAAWTATASAALVETVFIYLWNDFVARFELLQLRGAFFLDQFFLGGLDGVDQVGGLQQARRAD